MGTEIAAIGGAERIEVSDGDERADDDEEDDEEGGGGGNDFFAMIVEVLCSFR